MYMHHGSAILHVDPRQALADVGQAKGAKSALPLPDTIRRVLLSLPVGFRALLRHLLTLQMAVGEREHVPVNRIVEYLDTHGGEVVSQSRMRHVQSELTSNRLAHYDPWRHQLLIHQPQVVRQLLDELDSGTAKDQ
jgi:hypothetical protein